MEVFIELPQTVDVIGRVVVPPGCDDCQSGECYKAFPFIVIEDSKNEYKQLLMSIPVFGIL